MRFHVEADGVSVGFQGLAFGRRKRMREVALLAVEMVTARADAGREAVIEAALEFMGVPEDASELDD